MNISGFFLEYIVSFAVLIVILVFVHELGHFLFARWCGVKVESFSIGFGKELFGFTDKKGTRWKIAPIPLGGYVKMKGEMLPNSSELSPDKDAFHNKKLWQKTLIVFAGPLFNLLLPFLVYFIIAFFCGLPSIKPEIKNVLPNSTVLNVLQAGDLITHINNKPVKTFTEVHNIIKDLPKQEVEIKAIRNGKDIKVNVKVGEKEENNNVVGFLGIEANPNVQTSKRYGFIESMKISLDLYKTTMSNMLYGFKMLFTNKFKADDIGGPVKIAQLSGDVIKKGFSNWLFFLAALSINLAIINLLPIPALDGGHLFLYLIQFITRRPVPPKLQNTLVTVGFFILLSLIVLVTFNDILRLFK